MLNKTAGEGNSLEMSEDKQETMLTPQSYFNVPKEDTEQTEEKEVENISVNTPEIDVIGHNYRKPDKLTNEEKFELLIRQREPEKKLSPLISEKEKKMAWNLG